MESYPTLKCNCYMAVSILFVTTASTETRNDTSPGVTFVPTLPVPKVTPKIILVPLRKSNPTIQIHYANRIETPICRGSTWHHTLLVLAIVTYEHTAIMQLHAKAYMMQPSIITVNRLCARKHVAW